MMRLFFVGTFLSAALSPAFSQSRIQVSITNFENNKGTCIVCLYNNAKDFSEKGGKPVQCATVPVHNKTASAGFEGIPPGTYAIMVVHDANNNRKFDNNFLGIPKEGYGASQNKLPFAAAPKFEENKFVVADNSTVQCQIRLRYIL